MAVALDSVFSSALVTSTPITVACTPVGTPKGVIAIVIVTNNGTDVVGTPVQYGGVTMTEVGGSPNLKATGENGGIHVFFLGSSVPTGNQNLTVPNTAGATKIATAILLTAAGNTAVEDSDGTIRSDGQANPSVTLSLNGKPCFCAIGFFSGQGDPTTITPLTNWTSKLAADPGPQTAHVHTYDIVGTSDVTAGWTQASDDAIAIAIAISETVIAADLSSAGVATPSFVGNAYTPGALSASGAGAFAPVGADAQPAPGSPLMSKSNTFENDLMKLIFNATAIANIADNAASSPLTNLFVSLHTADPGEAGDQTTNETAYTGYARQTVARTTGGWTVTGNGVSPVANIDFPVCTASPGTTITHAAVGVAVSGASKILYKGGLSPQIAIAVGVIPRVTTASVITED